MIDGAVAIQRASNVAASLLKLNCMVGGKMLQSIDYELRGLREAGSRLENATKEWDVAYRLYTSAVDALNRKTVTKSKLATTSAEPIRLARRG
jgi:hypothetical protein